MTTNQQTRAKRWCLTLNNFTHHEKEQLKTLHERESKVTYIIFAEEHVQEGTPHLQGYLEFSSRIYLTKLSRHLPRAHLEIARGTAEQNIAYCSKEGTPYTWGTPTTQQGKRTDLLEVKKSIDSGASESDLWDHHFSAMVRYHKSFARYRATIQPRRSEPSKVFIFHGPTGTGKTRRAFAIAGEVTPFVYPGGGWFDGYTGQRVAVFDEFDGSDLSFALWKRICDRYPLLLPVKGGFTQWNPETIIFCSNIRPDSWWESEKKPMDWWDQFSRRITNTVLMNENWDPETSAIPE